jgi:MATE family multidrug resistance protein
MMPLGVAQSVSVLVGNMIGAKNIHGARIYSRMGSMFAFTTGLFSLLVMFVFEDQFISMFSSSVEVNQIIKDIYFMLLLFTLLECFVQSGSGIITGIGKQGLGSVITLISFWAIGIPLALLLVFYYHSGL